VFYEAVNMMKNWWFKALLGGLVAVLLIMAGAA
jgi:hypothetical protein